MSDHMWEIFTVAAIVVGLGWACTYYSNFYDECEAKGGEPYCAYKSKCVCLKPGQVIR